MEDLSKFGKYSLDLTGGIIKGYCATEDETSKAIKDMFEQNGYVLDTHTHVLMLLTRNIKKKQATIHQLLLCPQQVLTNLQKMYLFSIRQHVRGYGFL